MHFSPVLELYQWEMAIGGQRSAVSYELSSYQLSGLEVYLSNPLPQICKVSPLLGSSSVSICSSRGYTDFFLQLPMSVCSGVSPVSQCPPIIPKRWVRTPVLRPFTE